MATNRVIEVVSDYRDTLSVQVGDIILQEGFLFADSDRFLCKNAHGQHTLFVLKKHSLYFLSPTWRTPLPCIAAVSGMMSSENKLLFTIYGEENRDAVEEIIQQVERSLDVTCSEKIEPGKQFEQTIQIVGG